MPAITTNTTTKNNNAPPLWLAGHALHVSRQDAWYGDVGAKVQIDCTSWREVPAGAATDTILYSRSLGFSLWGTAFVLEATFAQHMISLCAPWGPIKITLDQFHHQNIDFFIGWFRNMCYKSASQLPVSSMHWERMLQLQLELTDNDWWCRKVEW